MIVAISCSSPFSSVAVISETGGVVFSAMEETKQNASGVCLRMLQASQVPLKSVKLYVADIGPGSFIGCRVGVTLAKTLAFANGVMAAGVSSFDLIDPDRAVAFPSKKGEWFLRQPGSAVARVHELPSGDLMGYGPAFQKQTYPEAARAASLLGRLEPVEPEWLLPEYHIEPSISIPKVPYKQLSS